MILKSLNPKVGSAGIYGGGDGEDFGCVIGFVGELGSALSIVHHLLAVVNREWGAIEEVIGEDGGPDSGCRVVAVRQFGWAKYTNTSQFYGEG